MNPSIVFPAITFIVVVATFGLSLFDVHQVSETEIEFVIVLVGTFGKGGLYKEVIREGFSKFKKIKDKKTLNNFFILFSLF